MVGLTVWASLWPPRCAGLTVPASLCWSSREAQGQVGAEADVLPAEVGAGQQVGHRAAARAAARRGPGRARARARTRARAPGDGAG